MVQISEKEYVLNEQRRLDELAQLVEGCGITLYELSKGTRIKYDTLLKVRRRRPIRAENEERIRYYIKIKNGSNENQTDRP